jgi:hypothetical protein
MKQSTAWLTLGFAVACGASAADYLRERDTVESMLSGARLQGTYLRTQSPYTLDFRTDGTLVNTTGEQGRWWVNEQGQYCREWLTGRLQGNKACLDLTVEGDTVAVHSAGKRVAEGRLEPIEGGRDRR